MNGEATGEYIWRVVNRRAGEIYSSLEVYSTRYTAQEAMVEYVKGLGGEASYEFEIISTPSGEVMKVVMRGYITSYGKIEGATEYGPYYHEQGPSRIAPKEVVSAGKLPLEQLSSRLFPKTYGDWVSLAEDIKAKYPDDPVMRTSVNFSLNQILMEEQCAEGWSAESADRAKRWLTEKAGELGIS